MIETLVTIAALVAGAYLGMQVLNVYATAHKVILGKQFGPSVFFALLVIGLVIFL